jgi:hypothetical protein
MSATSKGVHLDPSRLIDGRVGQAKTELADEIWLVEVGSAAPGQREAGHQGRHARAVVDERNGSNRVSTLTLPGLRPVENDVDALGPGLQRVVDEFPSCRGRVAVAVATLRLDRSLGVEEGKVEVFGESIEVLLLPADLIEQAIWDHLSLLQVMAAHGRNWDEHSRYLAAFNQQNAQPETELGPTVLRASGFRRFQARIAANSRHKGFGSIAASGTLSGESAAMPLASLGYDQLWRTSLSSRSCRSFTHGA